MSYEETDKIADKLAADAVAAVIAERAKTHGYIFAELATWLQSAKDHMRSAPGWEMLVPVQREALDADALKTARILHGNPNHPDHWLDKEGYARLVRERL